MASLHPGIRPDAPTTHSARACTWARPRRCAGTGGTSTPTGAMAFYTNLLAADLNLVVGDTQRGRRWPPGPSQPPCARPGASAGTSTWPCACGPCTTGTSTSAGRGHHQRQCSGQETWRLRKLGPRHPRTITDIKVADNGGVVSITQGYGQAGMPPPEIPSRVRLVAYVWDQPGNWVGRSTLPTHVPQLAVKDVSFELTPSSTSATGWACRWWKALLVLRALTLLELDKMAQEYKAGERGGGAVPNGSASASGGHGG